MHKRHKGHRAGGERRAGSQLFHRGRGPQPGTAPTKPQHCSRQPGPSDASLTSAAVERVASTRSKLPMLHQASWLLRQLRQRPQTIFWQRPKGGRGRLSKLSPADRGWPGVNVVESMCPARAPHPLDSGACVFECLRPWGGGALRFGGTSTWVFPRPLHDALPLATANLCGVPLPSPYGFALAAAVVKREHELGPCRLQANFRAAVRLRSA